MANFIDFFSVIKRLISMLYQYAALNANYEAVLKQANSANAELSRRIDSGQKASFSNWECKQCDTTQ